MAERRAYLCYNKDFQDQITQPHYVDLMWLDDLFMKLRRNWEEYQQLIWTSFKRGSRADQAMHGNNNR